MRVIILADGKTNENHMDDRHFIPFKGVPLLHRTINQFRKLGSVWVVAPEEYRARLGDLPVKLTQVERKEDLYFGVDMIRKGIKVMGSGENLLVFGDVWFSDEAVQTIKDTPHYDWKVFGRSEASRFQGSPWAEYFAISLHTSARNKALNAPETVANHYMSGSWHRASAWEWYKEMEGLPYYIPNPERVKVGGHWKEIHDRTDDFDFTKDIARWNGTL